MNRSAYFTTGFAIKTISSLSKADIVVHGEENIPKEPIIFVVNHFTRIETLLLPYYIYNLTANPVWSLADANLFKGGLRRFFDMVGVISTRDPDRDQIILRSLLTGETDWIIYPEGNMVKTKKTMSRGEFIVSSTSGGHKPHTGAASLALRAEFLRQHLLIRRQKAPAEVSRFLERFFIDADEIVSGKPISIVPVNLTYYPIRAKENIASTLAARLVKDISERMVEEIMAEGTMLLSGVDLDIRFGKPIRIKEYLQGTEIIKELETSIPEGFDASPRLDGFLRRQSSVLMERYMKDIYDMTTVNHEHLFSSFLRLYPWKTIREADLKRRVFQATVRIAGRQKAGCHLHRSLEEDQIHLLIDDRFGKYRNFIDLALEKGVLREENGMLVKERSKLSNLMNFHRGRIDNPVEIIANEVEPLKRLQRLIFSLAWQPDFLVKIRTAHSLLKKEQARFQREFTAHADGDEAWRKRSAPFLLHGSTRRFGVVLVHSYLANPEEVRQLACYLSGRGIWVYVPRLAGHGTGPKDLEKRTYEEWLEAVETGYAIISTLCEKVILGGMSVGGCLALNLASRVKGIAGVFAVCPPLALHDFSAEFMPSIDVWNRILAKIKGNSLEDPFFEFLPDDPGMSYDRNPVFGVREVGRLLDHLRLKLEKIENPILIIQASDNPVVDQKGSRQLFDQLGSKRKIYNLVESARHIIVNGQGSGKVHRMIENFIRDL
jgi:esterase/lipase/1-acyl-sn-glycerol-3-phosphate acyltransferase